jgi:hypothetical protein
MPIKTNLNSAPYFDDFDQADNYYKTLFRPSVPVQARELTSIQSTLQDQIDKFGRHIFKEGSIVEGGSIVFDATYSYAKLADNLSDGTAYDVASLSGYDVIDSDGLRAVIMNTVDGLESQTPDLKTIYMKYRNGVTINNITKKVFDLGSTLDVKDSSNTTLFSVVVSAAAGSIGNGYSFTMTEAVVFKNGFFIRVPTQTTIVTKYSSVPDSLSAGFMIEESVETSDTDPKLLDNAAGAPNYAAPGAHRLKLVPTMVVKELATQDTDDFFSIVDFKNGIPYSIRNTSEYSTLGREMARRTFEESGNYVVDQYRVIPRSITSNTTHFIAETSPGLAYVYGFRTQHVGRNFLLMRVADDVITTMNQSASVNMGSYLVLKEVAGSFDPTICTHVELHKQAYTAVTSKAFTDAAYLSTEAIGIARVGGVEFSSGIPGTPDAEYYLYVYRINMNATANLKDVRSVVYYNGANVLGIGDIVLNNGSCVLEASNVAEAVYPYGQLGVTPGGTSNFEYAYHKNFSATIGTNGTCVISINASELGASQAFEAQGTLSTANKRPYIVTSTSLTVTPAKAGTVSVASGNTTVTGISTAFSTTYKVDDYIKVGSIIKRVAKIANNTSLTVDTNYAALQSGATHWKAFPAGYVLPVSERSDNTIVVNGTQATININETLSSAMPVTISTCVMRSGCQPMTKVIKRNHLVKINCSNNAVGASGPWALGLTDVININAVYINQDGSYDATGTNYASGFKIINGQTDNYYDIAKLAANSTGTAPITAASTLLVDLDFFVTDKSQGVGFYNLNSYNVGATANNSHVLITEVPLYTAKASGVTYNLRDCVDFRPSVKNTATVTNDPALATVNPTNIIVFDVPTDGTYPPCPNMSFMADVQHYSPRIDRIVVGKDGRFTVVEGVATNDPVPPPEPDGTMSIALVSIPPYPSLVYDQMRNIPSYRRSDQFVTVSLVQNRRYTMKDIRTVDERVKILEYYTSLNELEKKATDMLVRDTNGNDRFKNGFIADPFEDHSIGDTSSPEYNIAIDPETTEMRPRFRQTQFMPHVHRDPVTGAMDPMNTNVVRTGRTQNGVYTLTFTEVEYIKQEYASKQRNCIEGNVLNHQGMVILYPNIDTEPDITQQPDIIASYDNNGQHGTINNSLTTNWGNWKYNGKSPLI